MIRPVAAILLFVALFSFTALAEDPATQPSTAASTQPLTISPEVKAILDQVTDAYAKPNSFEFVGHFSFDADAAGRAENHSADFTSTFAAPAKFRHEMKDDLLLVCANDKLFAYLLGRNRYMVFDPPKSRAVKDVAAPVREMLEEQDPSLLMAMSSDAGKELIDGALSAEKVSDVELDHVSYTALQLKQDDRDVRVLIDSKTGLIRQMQIDLRRTLERAGVPLVKKAMTVIEYTRSTAGPAIDQTKTFAWTPPKGAALMKADDPDAVAGGGGGAGDDDASHKLVGKPAPTFSLESVEGKTVALADLKGKVVVLDFWATWCPPCRESLPHLNELAKSKANDAVSVFAVNLRETKDKAGGYMTDNKLGLQVLLDGDGAVAEKYFVTGIPQTVVIGKDGSVKTVIVGYEPGIDAQLQKAVEDAMATK